MTEQTQIASADQSAAAAADQPQQTQAEPATGDSQQQGAIVAQSESDPQQEASVQQGSGAEHLEEDEKFFAALGYFLFLFVATLIVKPKSKYCKFHARQSMALFATFILVLIILAAIPWFGSLLTLALFAVYVLAIYKAYKGEYWNVPFISKFAGKMNVETLYDKAGLAVSSIAGFKEKASGFADKTTAAVAENLGKQEPEAPAQQTDQTDK